jgi:small GTP-binding protein
MDEKETPRFKIVVLGNSGVGKTSIILRWISNSFSGQTKQTIGSNHQRKRLSVASGEQVDLCIWDTAGQERFQALMPLYARAADMAVLTAAINDEISFSQLPKWIDLIGSSCDVVPPIVLAVNKTDLAEPGGTTLDDIHARYVGQFRGIFFVSAKTGENCEALIQFVADEAACFKRIQKQMAPSNLKSVIETDQQCC